MLRPKQQRDQQRDRDAREPELSEAFVRRRLREPGKHDLDQAEIDALGRMVGGPLQGASAACVPGHRPVPVASYHAGSVAAGPLPLPNAFEVTPFGVAVFVAAGLVFSFRRAWLLALLPACAVLQSPAAVVIGVGDARLGITPFNLLVAFCGLAMLFTLRATSPRHIAGLLLSPDRRLWTLFLLLATVTAWLLPLVFAGVPVHPLFAKGDVAMDPVPNQLSISHVAQSVNSIALLVVLGWAGTMNTARATRLIWNGLLAALVLSTLVSFYHRGALLGHYPLAADLWGSNPSYNQFFTSKYGPDYGRASLPFTEPSYASVWFAAMASSALAMAIVGTGSRASRLACLGAATLALAALSNTLGTSGVAAFILALPVVLLMAYFVRRASGRRYGSAPVWLVAATVIGAVIVCYVDYRHWRLEALAPVRAAIDFTQLKIAWAPSGPRVWSTRRALAIVIETFGFGVGPGSTRTSSYLIALLANMGIAGTGLFLLALLRQLRWLWSAAIRRDDVAAGLFAGTVACTIGVFGGIPDQNWPILWMFLIGGTVAATTLARDEELRRRGQPLQDLGGDGSRVELALNQQPTAGAHRIA